MSSASRSLNCHASGSHFKAGLAARAGAVILVHRPNIAGTAPERGAEVDLIAAKGWPKAGTAVVRFEPEYHRMVDLPNG
ncbi:hypothetical protein ACFV4P_31345 [Kitasatospora sp. NPDC059795]|uniref:hypothetical protein n=1 Tax=Kitasatospora sp. NPDC059795 TaxID=3346949 RepID=UPI0036653E88